MACSQRLRGLPASTAASQLPPNPQHCKRKRACLLELFPGWQSGDSSQALGVSPWDNVPYFRPGIGQGGCCRPQSLPPGGGVGETRAPPAVEPVGGTESARSPHRRFSPQSNRRGANAAVPTFLRRRCYPGRVLSIRRIRGWVGAEPKRPRVDTRGYPKPLLRSSIRMACSQR